MFQNLYIISLYIIIICCLPTPLHAGVSNFSRNTSITLFTESPNFSLNVNSNLDKNKSINLTPNTQSVDGLQISFNGKYGLSMGMKRSPNSESLKLYGDTRYQDFRFQYMYQSLFFNTYLQSFQGFYIQNSNKIDPGIEANDPRIQNSSLKVQNMGLNVFYIFEPQNYSLPAALYQSALQNSSGGSLMLGLSLSDFLFSSDENIIPSSEQASYSDDANLRKGHFSSANATLGYGYTFVFYEKFFISGLLLLGSGQELANFSTTSEDLKSTSKSIKNDFVLSAGFNGELMYVGFSGSNDNTNHPIRYATLNTGISNFNLHFGLRF